MEPLSVSDVCEHSHHHEHKLEHEDETHHEHEHEHGEEHVKKNSGWLFRFEIFFHILFIAAGISMIVFLRGEPFFKTFGITFSSIFLEAMPFMLLGSLIGGFIEEFISKDTLTGVLPKKQFISVFIAAAAGFVMPVCECAVVPVVRRLFQKGLPIGAGIAYLLGGPIVNPIVVFSTYTAYGNNIGIAVKRMLLGYLIAVTIGFLVEFFHKKATVLTEENMGDADACGCAHCCGHHHDPANTGVFHKIVHMFRHAAADFLDIGRFLVFGAFIAALLQSLVSRGALTSVTDAPLISIFFMMVLAFVLNLCSEADAFIAASFRTMTPLVSQTAFMVLGPMLDIKLILMYFRVFRKSFIIWLSFTTFIIVFLCMAAMHWAGV